MSSPNSFRKEDTDIYELEQLDLQQHDVPRSSTPFRPNLPPPHNPCMPFIVGLLIVFAVIVGTIIAFVSGADKFDNPGTVSRLAMRELDGITLRSDHLVANSSGPEIAGIGATLERGNGTLVNVTEDRGGKSPTLKGGGAASGISAPGVAVFVVIAVVSIFLNNV